MIDCSGEWEYWVVGIYNAEKFVRAWGIWEQGRSRGVAEAVETVDKFLCAGGLTEEQREILLRLYDSLLESNRHSVPAVPERGLTRGWRQTARGKVRTPTRSRTGS